MFHSCFPDLICDADIVDWSLSGPLSGLDAPAVVPSLKDLSKPESQPLPSDAAAKQDVLPPPDGAVEKEAGDTTISKLQKKNLTEDQEVEVMDIHEEDTQIEGMTLG